jgi:hypothetical protein
MDWILLILSSACFVEIFIRLGALGRIDELKEILLKVTKTIRSPRISDSWKQKVLPRYSLMLFLRSLLLFLIFIGALSLFFVFSISAIIFDGEFLELALSTKGILTSTIVAFSYAILISRKPEKNYSAGSRFLHQMVLGHPMVGEAIFDIERLMYASKTLDVSAGRHVFVAGLARAGTTILMRKLYENGQFCSLTYRDMPFILAPNMWRVLTNLSQRKKVIQERSHGDGLMVDYDSPEALEEVFWRVFCGSDYIKHRCLVPMFANNETLEKFRSFIGLVLNSNNDKLYLSKNNNNILRLNSITKAFPNAIIIVPFREPLQQAYSLMNQHQRFIRIHSTDPFTKKYMTWLAHHEFGADHRPFVFDESTESEKDTDSLIYWLKLWANTYSFIRGNLPVNAILLSYESLCDDTEFVWQRLAEKINLSPIENATIFSKSFHQVKESLAQDLLSQVTAIYNDLYIRSVGFRKDNNFLYT